MGYYITAELEVKNIKEQEKEEIQQYIDENEDDFYLIFPDGASRIDGKWYDRNMHFNKLSSQYPNALFCLYCDGEEFPGFHHDFHRCEQRDKGENQIR